MRKTRIYLDASVISHLTHMDAPDKMRDTQRLRLLTISLLFKNRV